MSASTLVEVLMDDVEILNGSLDYSDLFFFMGLTQKDKSIEMQVTLRTAVSRQTFERTLIITSVPRIEHRRRNNGIALLYGTIDGVPFKAAYKTKSRKGPLRLRRVAD